jgi:hypothetical protein
MRSVFSASLLQRVENADLFRGEWRLKLHPPVGKYRGSPGPGAYDVGGGFSATVRARPEAFTRP